jgi:hypothetical protein
MRRYYFDFRDSDDVIRDDVGVELASMGEVQQEAAQSLAEMARDALRPEGSPDPRRMAIEVRDGKGDPVLQVRFSFEVGKRCS